MYIADNTAEADLAQAIIDAANRGYDWSIVVDLIMRDHRTLQQSIARGLIAPLIEAWAATAETGRYDARNEATVLWAQRVMADAAPNGFPYI